MCTKYYIILYDIMNIHTDYVGWNKLLHIYNENKLSKKSEMLARPISDSKLLEYFQQF